MNQERPGQAMQPSGPPSIDTPSLGISRRELDPRLWAALLGRDSRRRAEAARTIRAREHESWYSQQLLEAIPGLWVWQRLYAGEALSLLGDPRFSPPHYLPEMIHVPAGTAVLGSASYRDERPVHAVHVKCFLLAQYPVTQAAYAVFVEAVGYRRPRHWRRGRPDVAQLNMPVVWVSARDAEAYCMWLSRETGYHYRLPTEAEWVLAARGDGDGRTYPWGEGFDSQRANVWIGDPLGQLCAVGMFPAGRGPYGHHDQAGNVWEWCSSLYWPYPYRADDGREDSVTDSEPRVMHGGSWRSRLLSIRCSARQGELPTDSFGVVGFRLARDVSYA